MRVKLISILLTVLFSSCSKENGDDITIVYSRTIEEVTEDFQNLNIQPGVNDISMESITAGIFWNFRVIAPANASETNKRPLVLALHGASGGSPAAHQSTSCYVEPGLVDLNAFIISPNAGTEQWYSINNQIQIVNLLKLARANWDVDISKVLVTGYSNGGNASWLYADFFPQYFTASIAMASSYNTRRSDGSITAITIPLYVIHSTGDELFPVAITQGFVDDSVSAGSNIEFIVVDGLSHYTPCDYVQHLKDGVTWVQTEVW